eukprot:1157270-Pelagomonas_calceolata.AAC.19
MIGALRRCDGQNDPDEQGVHSFRKLFSTSCPRPLLSQGGAYFPQGQDAHRGSVLNCMLGCCSLVGNTAGLIEALEAEAEARQGGGAGGEGITGSELGSRAAREEATRRAERVATVSVWGPELHARRPHAMQSAQQS